MRAARYSMALLWLGVVLTTPVHAELATVAVASNFSTPMQTLITRFEQQSGHRIRVAFGSSGKLYAQIEHGAPFDVFLSADTGKPQALIAAGNADANNRFTYAIGRLVLWSGPNGDDSHAMLSNRQFRKLAIANPHLAPYGTAAIQTLQQFALYEAVKQQLVIGENIAQTYQFIATGNAQLGFVAMAQIIDNGAVPAGAWPVPEALYSPIKQDAVLLKHGENNVAARALLDYLRSPAAGVIIEQFGYRLPEKPYNAVQ